MEIEDFKSNSNKSKERKREAEDKKVEKAIVGTAKKRKKSEIRKFADVFVPEDVDGVKTYILMDVIIPAIKKTIVDVVSDGISMLMYGEHSSRGSSKSPASKISYNKYYDDRDRRESRPRPRANTSLDYEDIVFDSRGDAESVLSRMDELMEAYDVVSVGDLYELAGISTDNYTVNRYGWTNIRNADVVRIRDGYVIKMPKPMPLD